MEQGKPVRTFKRIVLLKCQDEYQEHLLPAVFGCRRPSAAGPANGKLHFVPGIREKAGEAKQKLLSLLKVIGHLHRRQWIPKTVISEMMADLTGLSRVLPEEREFSRDCDFEVGCCCQLLDLVSSNMRATLRGKWLMQCFVHRLSYLKPHDSTVAALVAVHGKITA